MIAVGKHLVLARQERAARVDEVDTRQVILCGDLLRAQVLLDGQRIIGAAFYGRIVGDDHAFEPVNPADTGNDAGARHVVAVDLPRGLPADFEEMGILVEQGANAIPRQQLAALQMLLPGALGPALHDVVVDLAQVIRERLVRLAVLFEFFRRAIDLGLDDGHGSAATSRH